MRMGIALGCARNMLSWCWAVLSRDARALALSARATLLGKARTRISQMFLSLSVVVFEWGRGFIVRRVTWFVLTLGKLQ